ncbi:MAG: TraR/DksA C4-type zinc finger protein [Ilumatobacter sp.]
MSDTRALLEAVRADLNAREKAIRAGSEMPTGGISFGKRVGEGTSIAIERFADVAIHDQILAQIALVDRAMARLDDGEYGICQVCGEPIPEARLEVIPWAETSGACA